MEIRLAVAFRVCGVMHHTDIADSPFRRNAYRKTIVTPIGHRIAADARFAV